MPLLLTATDAVSGTYTKEEAASFLGRSVDAASQMILPDDTKALTDKEGFAGATLIGAGVCVATGMYTRSRAAKGLAPIAKVLF
jgi:hypothetical protein